MAAKHITARELRALYLLNAGGANWSASTSTHGWTAWSGNFYNTTATLPSATYQALKAAGYVREFANNLTGRFTITVTDEGRAWMRRNPARIDRDVRPLFHSDGPMGLYRAIRGLR